MDGIAALKAHLSKSTCKEKLSNLEDVGIFLRRCYPALNIESAKLGEKDWLIVWCAKYVELVSEGNNMGPIKPARVVFNSSGSYSFEVIFRSILTGSWIASEPPHTQITNILDTLLIHSRYCLCPGIHSYNTEFGQIINFKSKNLRIWCHPMMRHDSNQCLLWHRPNNSHLRTNPTLLNLCPSCKSLYHDLLQIKKRALAASLDFTREIRMAPPLTTPKCPLNHTKRNSTEQHRKV